MSNKLKIGGFILLVLCSAVYEFQKPTPIEVPTEVSQSYVTLEGEFKKQGKYEFDGEKTLQEVIDEVGVSEKANLDALSLTAVLKDESRIYLPPESNNTISLNQATKADFMTIKGIGEKKAQMIIDYRNEQQFTCLEDIMNVSGIGEKTYLRMRDFLCL